MKTIPVRVYTELKEDIDEAIRQYRKHTGENVNFAEMLCMLINNSEIKDMTNWTRRSYE